MGVTPANPEEPHVPLSCWILLADRGGTKLHLLQTLGVGEMAYKAGMTAKRHLHIADLRGYARLTIDATVGITDLVETMHRTILAVPNVFGPRRMAARRGIGGLVYGLVRGISRSIGAVIDMALEPLAAALDEANSSPEREAIIAALNGILGDHLATSHNPLAIEMQLRRDGIALPLTRDGLATSIPQPTGRILVLIHGLCMGDRQWRRHGHDHGAALAADLGITPVYVNFNSGLPVAANGRRLAALLENLLAAWPVPVEMLDILGFSMGGLLARSAWHHASDERLRWPTQVRKLAFLGTPHQGAPLERGGNWVNLILDASPYTAAFSRLAKLRSAGITDLRHGNVIDLPADDAPDRFAHGPDPRPLLPLPDGVACYALAGVAADPPHSPFAGFIGDGLVPRDSALGRHADTARCLAIPRERQWTGNGLHHLDLLDSPKVYRKLLEFLA